MQLKIKKLTKSAKIPTKAHDSDLGWDLFANEDIIIEPKDIVVISTGIAVKFPEGYGAFIKDRSSMAAKFHTHVLAGVIDPDYTGEIKIVMVNLGKNPIIIEKGMKIAQMVLIQNVQDVEIKKVKSFEKTKRNTKGFGSSGEK